jgi:hypothetical protein
LRSRFTEELKFSAKILMGIVFLCYTARSCTGGLATRRDTDRALFQPGKQHKAASAIFISLPVLNG